MKLLIVACLVACSHANFLDQVGHALGNVVDTVGHGVVDAANTVGDGVVDAAHTVGDGVVDAAHTVGDGLGTAVDVVGGVLGDIGHTIDATFPKVWDVVKDPLKDAGEKLLIQAGEFALQQGVTMALSALAAGKREFPVSKDAIKAYLSAEIVDEYHKWLKETESQILGSKDELATAMKTLNFNQMPAELRTYISDYVKSSVQGDQDTFILKQADTSMKNALKALEDKLENRLASAIGNISKLA